MNEKELKKMLSELEAQGWNPQLCDTPMACFDNAVACGKPAGVGDITSELMMMPAGLQKMHPMFFAHATGDSMKNANLEEGDMVLVVTGMTPSDGDIVLASINGEYTIKAYCKDEFGSPWMVPQNSDYDAFRLPTDESAIIWGVVQNIMKQSPRISYRACLRDIQKSRAKEQAPKVPGSEEVQAAIRDIAPKVTNGRQWFAVYRALADRKLVGEECFEAFCRLVAEAVPEHPRLPVYTEMQRMSVMCFAKPIGQWQADNAPVTGKRYLDYLMLAKEMLKRLEENVKK